MLLDRSQIKLNEEIFRKEIGINFDWHEIDDLIISDSNILRPVKGYAFEYLIDEIFKKHFNINLNEGSGDTDIDRYFFQDSQKTTLQIKTPAKASTKYGKTFGYSLHKTHGKEKRPKNLYPIEFPCPICPHEGESFPDFLIGQHPDLGVMIIPKNNIPESKSYPGHFSDPAKFSWENNFLNAWGLLSFKKFHNINLLRGNIPTQTKFPKTSSFINLTDEELIYIFLKPENFRLLHMNLRGNLREPFVKKILLNSNIGLQEKPHTYEKYDLITQSNKKIQIKGVSKQFSDTKLRQLKVEVMGTHGQGSQRRYSKSDFDYLCVVIDPKYIPKDFNLDRKQYSFFFLKSIELPDHPKYLNHEKRIIYENCKFEFKVIENKIFLVASKKYNLPIKFNFQLKELNKIPSELKICNQ